MRYIKGYKTFEDLVEFGRLNDFDVVDICKKYGIKNYTINQDGSIDVDGDVNLSHEELTKLPLKFGKVSGHFLCSNNNLTSLEGSPKEVRGGFYCSNNQLTSLEGSPDRIDGSFYCDNNELISLEGSPNVVIDNFICFNNKLTSLEGYPDRVGGSFYCNDNPIHNIYKLFNNPSQIELFNDYDIIRDDGSSIVLDRLNAFLEDIGEPPVDNVKGYKNT